MHMWDPGHWNASGLHVFVSVMEESYWKMVLTRWTPKTKTRWHFTGCSRGRLGAIHSFIVYSLRTCHQPFRFDWGVCIYWRFHPNTLTAFAVLVAAVTAVVGSVTHPAVGNAAVVLALELGGWAELIYGSRRKAWREQNKATWSEARRVYLYVPQWASSAPFSQSFSLSHVQLIGIQRPLGQAKKGVGHFVFPVPGRMRDKSSQCKI